MSKSQILAEAGVQIVADDDGMLELLIATAAGPVTVVASLVRAEDCVTLDRVDVDGAGLTLTTIRKVAKAFGRAEDVSEVVVQGGLRTSGAGRGTVPTAIRVRVNE